MGRGKRSRCPVNTFLDSASVHDVHVIILKKVRSAKEGGVKVVECLIVNGSSGCWMYLLLAPQTRSPPNGPVETVVHAV